MRKTTLALMLAGTMMAVPAVHAVDLTNEEQKLSYSLGLILGDSLKQDFAVLNMDAFREGIETIYSEGEPLLSREEVAEVMQAYQQRIADERRQAFEALSQENIQKGQAYLAENAKRNGVTTTDSGLQYEELEAGSGASPTAEDTVKVHYRGQLIDGTEFDSSYSRNDPVSFPLNGVIPGWTEGLQLMKEGAKSRLVIPAELAYGEGGMGNAIGPNETLVFEVELLQINP
ncbi:FKBP-type peptidyl-prolyl cis-trans isomerase [Nitrincola sp. MINF-07-Sa-05]|uniref:FKBP-type peptidyl-prolyl cis-trans isomerase n=1 Tax=Nitrincola salilacus TaxID=3400273 RepID=UPI00391805F9